MHHGSVLLAYLGPETWLPMTSAVAAVSGVLLMGGRASLRALRRITRVFSPTAKATPINSPHRHLRRGQETPSRTTRP